MSPTDRMSHALNRIASATSIIRTRESELSRLERNGGDQRTHHSRVSSAIDRLERVADELEKAIL